MTPRPIRFASPVSIAALAHPRVPRLPRAARGAAYRVACLAGFLAALIATPARAQTAPAPAAAGWQSCAAQADASVRLACFDRWAATQGGTMASTSPAGVPAPLASTTPAAPAPDVPVNSQLPATRIVQVSGDDGCHDRQYSELSRLWELEPGTDCGTFGIRGYRPISLSWIASNSVNTAPSSPSSGHTAGFTDYKRTETRIQLSVRTKIAQGLLTQDDPTRKDSLWFGYTQQSYWQLFSGNISRPFRTTDHEPELIYVYPVDLTLTNGWRVRYGGVGLVHQSNGQSLPLSRSWNRVYLMGGMEKDDTWRVQARVWQRLPERAADDDNPDISNYVGRAEISGWWNADKNNALGVTWRTALKSDSRGSVRLEWLRALGTDSNRNSGLRFHTQLFTGYGDSLVDYNRRRTVLSVGLSLIDF